MKAKHTKGPWKVDYHTTMNLPYKYTISNTQESDEEAEANAKLISAAPDLLNALKIAYNTLKATYPLYDEWTEAKVITNAIKKATE